MLQSDRLSTELTVFDQHRAEWSQSHPSKYVVIQDHVILPDFFENYADAMRAGLNRFGSRRSFLVKQVWIDDPVYFVS